MFRFFENTQLLALNFLQDAKGKNVLPCLAHWYHQGTN